MNLIVLMPLRDDWVSARELIRRLDAIIHPAIESLEVLIVDDCSTTRCSAKDFQANYSTIRAIRSLRLRRNLSHQRAIAVGLSYIQHTAKCDAIVVMDSDGEDTPEGVVQLLDVFSKYLGAKAVFAGRSRRSEGFVFRLFYRLYKGLHRCLTGIQVQVGNFSILPFAYLNTLVVMSEMWNHYAAAVFRSGLAFSITPIPRGRRIAGTSKMNFVSLVTHGLSAISVFGDTVGVRLLIASLLSSLLAAAGIVIVVGVRLFTDQAIPGWATYAVGTLTVMMIQLVSIALSFTFFMLANRTNLGFLPSRDYSYFVEEIKVVYPA